MANHAWWSWYLTLIQWIQRSWKWKKRFMAHATYETSRNRVWESEANGSVTSRIQHCCKISGFLNTKKKTKQKRQFLFIFTLYKKVSWMMMEQQGNLVARGLIEFCDDAPPVYNYISLAGPHAGISSVPWCGVSISLSSSNLLL